VKGGGGKTVRLQSMGVAAGLRERERPSRRQRKYGEVAIYPLSNTWRGGVLLVHQKTSAA